MGFLDPKPQTTAGLDAAVTAKINTPASAIATALTAAYVPKWKATTAYLAGDKVLSPAGDTVTAKVNFTSGGSYVAANWSLSTNYPQVTQVTAGKGLQAAAAGTARTVVLTGHSLVYGQDTSATGTLPAANGSTFTRSSTPPPEKMDEQSNYTSPVAVTVVNQGFPGDRTTEAITRWVAGVSGDLEIFWLDTNDGMNYGNYASGTLTDEQTALNLRDLVQRARGRGAEVVVIGGAPVVTTADARKVLASAETERVIAERYGARYVDVGEMLTALSVGTAMFTDGAHLSPQAYSLIGSRLAALLGPKGLNPPAAAPGRRFTPRDRVHIGGTETARTGSSTGNTLRLTAGQTLAIPVDVKVPCVPVFKLYNSGTTLGYGEMVLFSNLTTSDQPRRRVTIAAPSTGSVNTHAYVPAQPLLSPGPDTVVIQCTTGTIEVDSIAFVPVQHKFSDSSDITNERSRFRDVRLHPVGGKAQRANTSWDAAVDITSGISLRDGATKVGCRWVFDLTLGVSSSGVLLAQTTGTAAYVIETGYMIIRIGDALVLRAYNQGAVTDVSVAATFAATGIVRALFEIAYDHVADSLDVYVDGVLKGSIATPVFTFLSAGLIAGSVAGGGYAAGTGTAYMATNTYYA